MLRLLGALSLLALGAGCTAEADVNHDGRYGFLPGAFVPDTVPRPLRGLLIIDEDAATDRTLYYYFEGDLSAAGLGLESLDRLAFRHNRFEMRFDLPLEAYVEPGTSGEGSPIRVDVQPESEEDLELRSLDAAGLNATGASRFVSSLSVPGGTLRAYFGRSRLTAGALLTLPTRFGARQYALELEPAEITPSRQEEALVVDVRDTPGDYRIFDVFQSITRRDDALVIEAILRVSLDLATPFALHPAMFLGSFERGCWSNQRPLYLRVIQVAQSYQQHTTGDLAVIHRRSDTVEVPEVLWTDVDQPTLAAYCADYD